MVKNKVNPRIIFIILLLIISGILIYFSTSNKDIKINYNFKENMNSPQIKLINNENKILNLGNITIKNEGILITKIKLKNILGCIEKQNVFLKYIDKKNDNSLNYYLGSNQNQYIEINSGEKKIIKINFDYFPQIYNEKGEINSKNYSGKKLYIYELKNKNNLDSYSFCQNSNLGEAFKIINIK